LANGKQYLTIIEDYSSRVSYDPLIFLGESSDPLSHLFNLPLLEYLAKREKLPTVVRSFMIDQVGATVLELDYTSSFKVGKNRIDEQNSILVDHRTTAVNKTKVMFGY
jgi:hypothetical protein